MTSTGSVSGDADPLPAATGRQAIAEFAAELQAMRHRAGSPSYRAIGRSAHFAISTLADATGGKRLPTEKVVRAFAAACGEDPDAWAVRLAETARQVRAAAHQEESGLADLPQETENAPATQSPRHRIRIHRSLQAAALAVVFGAGYLLAAATSGHPTKTTSGSGAAPAAVAAAHTYPATDGDNPITAGCTDDVYLLDKSALMQNGTQVGALELKYSPRCHAGWARVYLYPVGVTAGLAAPNGPVAAVTVTANDGTSSSYASVLDKQQPNFTDAITPHGGCLKASASLTPPGGAPITAAIPCDSPENPPSAAPPTTSHT